MIRSLPYLRLMRPANIVTAVADIIAGFAISGLAFSDPPQLFRLMLLIIATAGLYGGGVVLNDVFDAELDKKERPERPIPQGQVSVRKATILALALFLTAIISSLLVSPLSGLISFAIALMATTYNKWAKHHVLAGPLAMGSCRALNLLLGISASAEALDKYWAFAGIPLVFIAAVTLLSQGEVHGGNKLNMILSGSLFLLVFTMLNSFPLSAGRSLIFSFPLSVLFLIFVLKPFFKAYKTPEPGLVKKAVKAGVLSVILSDATMVAAFSGVFPALLVLLLLPLSALLAKTFAVT